MANHKKPVAGFKPGVSGNPNGRPRVPVEIKESRLLTHYKFEQLCNKFLEMNFNELEPLSKSKDIPMIELMIISCIVKGIKEGSTKHLDFLLNRLIGSVVREIKIKVPDRDPSLNEIPIPMTTDEKLQMIEKFRLRIEDQRNEIDVTPITGENLD